MALDHLGVDSETGVYGARPKITMSRHDCRKLRLAFSLGLIWYYISLRLDIPHGCIVMSSSIDT
jgi:hypothetical protein